MARRRVQYGVVNASDADVGAGAPGFRTTWQSKDDLRQQVMKISDVPNNGKLYFWDGQLWLRWDDPDDLPGPEGDPLRIKIVCPQNAGMFLSFVLAVKIIVLSLHLHCGRTVSGQYINLQTLESQFCCLVVCQSCTLIT